MRVMGAQKEQDNGDTEQEFLGWCILGTVVDLLPHVQVVIRAAVEVERYTSDPMEHNVRAEHVADVGECPRRLLRNARDDIPENLQTGYQNEVYSPRPYSMFG